MQRQAGADVPSADPHLRLSLNNERSALEPARLAVLQFLSPWALSAQVIYRVELVLEEVLVNAVSYAFPDGGVHAIELAVEIHPDGVVLRFEDDGVAFDPLQAPDPPEPTTIDVAKPGGRGLMLVRKFAKGLAYQRSPDRNRFTVVIARL
jgi:anti-sigma regulatory factor (Ser/Thr protein kinase)